MKNSRLVCVSISTTWAYDARGNVLSEVRVISGYTYTVGYTYDTSNKLTQLTYPSGRTVTYGRDSQGRVSGVTTKATPAATSQTLAYNIAYQPYGALQSIWYGNGLDMWRTFTSDDLLDRLLVEDTSTSTVYIRRYHTRTDGLNLTNIYDDVDSTKNQSFWYSPAGRLQNASGPWGALTYYHDGVGNRTYEIADVGSTHTEYVTGYPANSNKANGVTVGGSTVRSYGYDAAGNMTTDTKSGVTWNYTYNKAGRLSLAKSGTTTKGTYTYDGLERLAIRVVSNTTPSGTSHQIYDTSGNMIAETNGAGATTREYVWIDDLPVAVVGNVNTTPVIYYVHVDHLNRPIKMTNTAKAVVWDTYYRPFGEVYSTTGSVSMDARFPGQWFQLETGLAYNWHRQYDATQGRYTQPDPLGFADGPSVFAYVGSAPQTRVDHDGQIAWWVAPVVLGAGDLLKQLYFNGGRLECVDWWEVGGYAASGLGFGQIASRAGAIRSLIRWGGKEGPSSRYDNSITNPGAAEPNIATDVTATDFINNLRASGYNQSTTPKGTQVLTNGTNTYSVYTRDSTDTAGAQFVSRTTGVKVKFVLGGP